MANNNKNNNEPVIENRVKASDFVPEDHYLNQVKSHVDFPRLDTILSSIPKSPNSSMDTSLVFKILLLGYLHGETSEPKLLRELQVNLAYRHFTNLDIHAPLPKPEELAAARYSQSKDILFQKYFREVIRSCEKAGFISLGKAPDKPNPNIETKVVTLTAEGYLKKVEISNPYTPPEHSKIVVKEEQPKTVPPISFDPKNMGMVLAALLLLLIIFVAAFDIRVSRLEKKLTKLMTQKQIETLVKSKVREVKIEVRTPTSAQGRVVSRLAKPGAVKEPKTAEIKASEVPTEPPEWLR